MISLPEIMPITFLSNWTFLLASKMKPSISLLFDSSSSFSHEVKSVPPANRRIAIKRRFFFMANRILYVLFRQDILQKEVVQVSHAEAICFSLLGDYTLRTHAGNRIDFQEPRLIFIQNIINSDQAPAMQKVGN